MYVFSMYSTSIDSKNEQLLEKPHDYSRKRQQPHGIQTGTSHSFPSLRRGRRLVGSSRTSRSRCNTGLSTSDLPRVCDIDDLRDVSTWSTGSRWHRRVGGIAIHDDVGRIPGNQRTCNTSRPGDRGGDDFVNQGRGWSRCLGACAGAGHRGEDSVD